jgi:5'-nucleotidase/UDP-sugar diphosphatase
MICGSGQLQSQTTTTKAKAKTFTILHTNDLHSSFIGMGPSSDYTPFKLNDDKTIDISGKDEKLYSLTTPVYLGMIIVAIPKYSKGQHALAPKNAKGEPLKTKVEALEMPKENAAEMLAPNGIVMDKDETVLSTNKVTEIKEWQAIMDYLCKLPVKEGSNIPVVPVDARAAEVRAIKVK